MSRIFFQKRSYDKTKYAKCAYEKWASSRKRSMWYSASNKTYTNIFDKGGKMITRKSHTVKMKVTTSGDIQRYFDTTHIL